MRASVASGFEQIELNLFKPLAPPRSNAGAAVGECDRRRDSWHCRACGLPPAVHHADDVAVEVGMRCKCCSE